MPHVRLVPLKVQITCIIRELGMRQRVYPGWVKNGKMKGDVMIHEIERMRAVLEELCALEAHEAGHRMKLVIEAEDNGGAFVVTGAFNGFAMDNIRVEIDALAEILLDHEVSQATVDRMLGVRREEA